MVVCLSQVTDLHMAQLMPLLLTISCSSESILVLPFWCQLTWVVPDIIQKGHKTVCVCVCVCFYVKISGELIDLECIISVYSASTSGGGKLASAG